MSVSQSVRKKLPSRTTARLPTNIKRRIGLSDTPLGGGTLLPSEALMLDLPRFYSGGTNPRSHPLSLAVALLAAARARYAQQVQRRNSGMQSICRRVPSDCRRDRRSLQEARLSRYGSALAPVGPQPCIPGTNLQLQGGHPKGCGHQIIAPAIGPRMVAGGASSRGHRPRREGCQGAFLPGWSTLHSPRPITVADKSHSDSICLHGERSLKRDASQLHDRCDLICPDCRRSCDALRAANVCQNSLTDPPQSAILRCAPGP
jgi:hypothetical protein